MFFPAKNRYVFIKTLIKKEEKKRHVILYFIKFKIN